MIKARYLAVAYQGFSMKEVSVTSHCDDATIRQLWEFRGIKVHRIEMFFI